MSRVFRISRKVSILLAIATMNDAIASHSLSESIASANPNWITRSNENTNLLIKAESESNCTNQPTLSESLLKLDSNYVQCYEKNLNNTI
ncbi:MAG: hypothetical protein C4287_11765, partial [Leptolyngbya sp. ERB_1_2]